MEIKSPLSKAGMTIEEAYPNKTFFLEKLGDETVRLKRNHDYYVQIQGQLYCSNLDLKKIIFIVYFGENRPLFVEKWTSDSLPKISFTDVLFSLSFLPDECSGGKILYLHGGCLPYGQYCCKRAGLKMRFQKQL